LMMNGGTRKLFMEICILNLKYVLKSRKKILPIFKVRSTQVWNILYLCLGFKTQEKFFKLWKILAHTYDPLVSVDKMLVSNEAFKSHDLCRNYLPLKPSLHNQSHIILENKFFAFGGALLL
jgi:hypothetical protein